MLEYKWCIIEIESLLSNVGWKITERIEPKLEGHHFRKWMLEKKEHLLELEFYHVPPHNYTATYTSDLLTYACKIKGTTIGLAFLEYHQKALWMDLLQQFVKTINDNYNLVGFGGHAATEISAEEAIQIAQNHIEERPKMCAKVRGISWAQSWIDGNKNLYDNVWIVLADNLHPGPFEGANTYNLVVNTRTRQVEDVSVN